MSSKCIKFKLRVLIVKYLTNSIKMIFFVLASTMHAGQESDLHITVQSKKTKKVTIGLVLISPDYALKQVADRIQKDFEWSGQCVMAVKTVPHLDHYKMSEFKNMFDQNVSAALFLSKHDHHITWRLYDLDSVHMIAGHQEPIGEQALSLIAHAISDKVWPYLFGTASCFQSKIAYCKQIYRKKHGREKVYQQIWITDFDGSNAELFVNTPTVNLAPRWNNDPEFPLLFYSENTMSNVQLVLSNMFGKRKVICSFDGLNMQPSFSKDGSKIVFCLSKDGTSQLYLSVIDKVTKKRIYERLTSNDGRNIAPCFIDDNHVIFVSDYQTNKPQLYVLDLQTKEQQRLTDGGYCACPNYSSVRNQLVYSKMVGGAMQLFIYDFKTQAHQQITDSQGSKEEGCWSSCGNYIVFGWNHKDVSRIAQLCVPTGIMKFLTSPDQFCTYPYFSPIYNQFLGVLNH